MELWLLAVMYLFLSLRVCMHVCTYVYVRNFLNNDLTDLNVTLNTTIIVHQDLFIDKDRHHIEYSFSLQGHIIKLTRDCQLEGNVSYLKCNS